jgi:predicted 3-demethylubiquinone-9 3-methyltransferase (glyoxalase superfamily)
MPRLQTITPCLWFDGQAEAAVTFYTGIFKNSKINNLSREHRGVAACVFWKSMNRR